MASAEQIKRKGEERESAKKLAWKDRRGHVNRMILIPFLDPLLLMSPADHAIDFSEGKTELKKAPIFHKDLSRRKKVAGDFSQILLSNSSTEIGALTEEGEGAQFPNKTTTWQSEAEEGTRPTFLPLSFTPQEPILSKSRRGEPKARTLFINLMSKKIKNWKKYTKTTRARKNQEGASCLVPGVI